MPLDLLHHESVPRLAPGRTEAGARVSTCNALDYSSMQAIAVGLGQSAPMSTHRWVTDGERRYTGLLRTDLYDAWLIAWRPSSLLDLHDHGGSRGVVAVVQGELAETYADDPLATLSRRRLASGATVAIPETRVHAVSNPGCTDALSVHVYSPPLGPMTSFESSPVGLVRARPEQALAGAPPF